MGKQLSEFTVKKVIIIVLAMLFSWPVFESWHYVENPESYSFGLHFIHLISKDPNAEALRKKVFDDTVKLQQKLFTPLLAMKIWDEGH